MQVQFGRDPEEIGTIIGDECEFVLCDPFGQRPIRPAAQAKVIDVSPLKSLRHGNGQLSSRTGCASLKIGVIGPSAAKGAVPIGSSTRPEVAFCRVVLMAVTLTSADAHLSWLKPRASSEMQSMRAGHHQTD